MQKPPHTTTIELTPAQMRRGQREHQFSLWLAAYRAHKMPDGEWEVLMQWDEFTQWFRSL